MQISHFIVCTRIYWTCRKQTHNAMKFLHIARIWGKNKSSTWRAAYKLFNKRWLSTIYHHNSQVNGYCTISCVVVAFFASFIKMKTACLIKCNAHELVCCSKSEVYNESTVLYQRHPTHTQTHTHPNQQASSYIGNNIARTSIFNSPSRRRRGKEKNW